MLNHAIRMTALWKAFAIHHEFPRILLYFQCVRSNIAEPFAEFFPFRAYFKAFLVNLKAHQTNWAENTCNLYELFI